MSGEEDESFPTIGGFGSGKPTTPPKNFMYDYSVNSSVDERVGDSPLKGREMKWTVNKGVELEDMLYPSLSAILTEEEEKSVASPLPSIESSSPNPSSSPISPFSKYSSPAHSFGSPSNSVSPMSSPIRRPPISNAGGKYGTIEEDSELTSPIRKSPYTGLRWKVDVSAPYSAVEHRSELSPSENLHMDMDNIGELFLRNRMKNKFRWKLFEEEKKKKAVEARKNNLLLKSSPDRRGSRRESQRNSSSQVFSAKQYQDMLAKQQAIEATPDDVYEQLQRGMNDKRVAVEENMRQTVTGAILRSSSAKQLEKLSEEEESYYRQKLFLSAMNNEEENPILDGGVLYYRIRNEINSEVYESDDDDEFMLVNDDDAETSANQPKRKKVFNEMLQAISKERADSNSNGLHLRREMRVDMAEKLCVDYAADLERFLVADQNRSSTDGLGYSINSLDTEKQARVPSYQKRVAQDMLMTSQLKEGQLPEIFIKTHTKRIDKMSMDAYEQNIKDELEGKKSPKRTNPEDERYNVDLSNYGIGDVQGKCLGDSLVNFDALEKLVLMENRLTHRCIPHILQNLSARSVIHIDLSCNTVHGNINANALAAYFKVPNAVKVLNLSKTGFQCQDIQKLCQGLGSQPYQPLEELILEHNKIGAVGAAALSAYLCREMTLEIDKFCYRDKTVGKSITKLKSLNLAWNNVKEEGASLLAVAIRTSLFLKFLDLSANGIDDKGGQKLGSAIPFTESLETLILQQNYIMSPACFVFSRVLKAHVSMQVLDLSLNPVGEPGARSLFRTILSGLRCFVMMRSCTFDEDANIFNHSNPSVDSPYELDLSVPYDTSVTLALRNMMEKDPQNCKIQEVTYREKPGGGPSVAVGLQLSPTGDLCLKGTTERWVPPMEGVVNLKFIYNEKIPTLDMKASKTAMFVLQIIIVTARTEDDRKKWLRLLCADLYCTCEQAQSVIDHFVEKQVIGIGGLKKIDVVTAMWNRLLDPENMIPFLMKNLTTPESLKTLIYNMSVDIFKFNWVNPTGHWRFNLANRAQRLCMTKFIAINRLESEHSERKSGREDTSQQGDWYNFRNATYEGPPLPYMEAKKSPVEETAEGGAGAAVTPEVPFMVDKEFTENMPVVGMIEFDYVSTRRPMQGHKAFKGPGSDDPAKLAMTLSMSNDFDFAEGGEEVDDADGTRPGTSTSDTNATANGNATSGKEVPAPPLDSSPKAGSVGKVLFSTEELMERSSPPPSAARRHRAMSGGLGSLAEMKKVPEKHPKDMLITEDELYQFLKDLGLQPGRRVGPPETIFRLAYLQVASTKYYFHSKTILSVMECFSRDPIIQAKVVTSLFSRLWDLHNMDVIMKQMTSEGQHEVIKRLGYLNIMNPLKPGMDYNINMLNVDDRKMLINLLEVAPSEGHDIIKEDSRTDLAIVDMFGSINRIYKQKVDECVMFNYGDFGERSASVSWNLRHDNLKRFLLGSKPVDKEALRIIWMYNQLARKDELSIGPVETQYAMMLKREAEAKAEAANRGRKKLKNAAMRVMMMVKQMKQSRARGEEGPEVVPVNHIGLAQVAKADIENGADDLRPGSTSTRRDNNIAPGSTSAKRDSAITPGSARRDSSNMTPARRRADSLRESTPSDAQTDETGAAVVKKVRITKAEAEKNRQSMVAHYLNRKEQEEKERLEAEKDNADY